MTLMVLTSFAQKFPIKYPLGWSQSLINVGGGIYVPNGIIMGNFIDTTAANTAGLKPYVGTVIRVGKDLYVNESNKWNLIAGGVFQPLENQRLSNTNAVGFKRIFLGDDFSDTAVLPKTEIMIENNSTGSVGILARNSGTGIARYEAQTDVDISIVALNDGDVELSTDDAYGSLKINARPPIPIRFLTQNTDRLIIPANGIVRSANPVNKTLLIDTVTKIMYYGDNAGGSGSSYTASSGVVLQGNNFKLQDTLDGAGIKLMWLKNKGAFRAGQVSGTEWNYSNIGYYSTSFGLNNTSSGNVSTTFGKYNIASDEGSTAFGSYNTVTGGAGSALGFQNTVTGGGATAIGQYNFATGVVSNVLGQYNKSKSYAGTVLGHYNDSTNAASSSSFNVLNRAFQIGIGTADNLRKNAMTVLFNGNVGIGNTAETLIPDQKLVVDGSVRFNNSLMPNNNAGTMGQVLTSQGSGVAPSWQTPSGGGSMVYPGAGIPLSTGSAWGTSITNNSANWNTAFGWGNHAGLYYPLTGNPSGFLTSYTETDPTVPAYVKAITSTQATNLTSVAATGVGIIVKSATNTYVERTLANGTNIAITNPAGTAGNPTIGITGSIAVANGGSGRATATTAYGLIAAGTTATGVQQTIAPGTAGQFLKSNGTSALGSFSNIAQSDVTNLATDLAAKYGGTVTTGYIPKVSATGTLSNSALSESAGNLSTSGNITAAEIWMTGSTIKSSNSLQLLTLGNAANTISTGGILASDSYADITAVPANGIYSKGAVRINGLSNASGDVVTTAVNGTLQRRTLSQLKTDMGIVDGISLSQLNDSIAKKTVKITAKQGLYIEPTDSSFRAKIVNNVSDSGIATPTMKSYWDAKQDALVSGTNIKTINGNSLLGSGDITISGTGAPLTGIGLEQEWIIALSDETTVLTAGTAKVTFRVPYLTDIIGVRASVNTASSSGLITVDINENGTSILGNKLTIDASEKTSTTAAIAATITDSNIADDAEVTIDIDTAGTGAKGLKLIIYYKKNTP